MGESRCSAFVYASSAGSPTVIVTANHATANPPPPDIAAKKPLEIRRLNDTTVYTCSVVTAFDAVDGVAILACPGLSLDGLGLAPSSDKKSAARSHPHVAATRFMTSDIKLAGSTRYHISGDYCTALALFIRHGVASNIASFGANNHWVGEIFACDTELTPLRSPSALLTCPFMRA